MPLSALGSISFTMAGPTTDYGYTSFGSNVTTPGLRHGKRRRAPLAPAGTARIPSRTPFRAKATGTYAIGIEARRDRDRAEPTPAGTQSITYGAPNVVTYFSVDGSTGRAAADGGGAQPTAINAT